MENNFKNRILSWKTAGTIAFMLLCCLPQAFAQVDFKREFRATWIATVANIDWPKSQVTSPKQQQEDFIELLNFYQENNFNAVIVQVRTAGDALYPSELSPWSRFLTGKEGAAPTPFYDPLAFMIKACHDRGLEFHAWFNPYRATTSLDTALLSSEHLYYTQPDWLRKYGSKYYFDPGLPGVREHFTQIIAEVLDRYDVDGIHFDDYFYPYRIDGLEFPDEESFQQYGQGFEDKGDWRRANVDSLVKDVAMLVHSKKPWVEFGISPFGVWRNADVDPKGSQTQALQTCYDDLYADPISWMRNGWMDYMNPQIYWSMEFDKANYKKLADWWADQAEGVPIYTGNGIYKAMNNADSAWFDPDQIPRQLAYNEEHEAIKGYIFFSAKTLPSQDWLLPKLKEKALKESALPLVNRRAEGPLAPMEFSSAKVKSPFLSKKRKLHLEWDSRQMGSYQYLIMYRLHEKGEREILQKVNVRSKDQLVIENLESYSSDAVLYLGLVDPFRRVLEAVEQVHLKGS